jgi:cyclase
MGIVRVIPRLDIKGPNLVKGIHLEGLRVLGKPEDFAEYYYENGADELMLQDVVASLFERNSLDDIISKIAKKIFIPLTVGGGLRTIEDIQRVLRYGADKVAINTGAIKNPDFIKEAAIKFGSSTIVVAIEAIKESDGRYLAYVDNGRDYTGIEVIEWAKKVEELGAGEIILTSVDKDGTGEGFDNTFIKSVVDSVSVPVIAHGGAGKKEHVIDVFEKSNVHSVACASIFHYDFIANNKTQVASVEEGNVEFLKSNRSFHNFETTTISSMKDALGANNINCRP